MYQNKIPVDHETISYFPDTWLSENTDRLQNCKGSYIDEVFFTTKRVVETEHEEMRQGLSSVEARLTEITMSY